MTNIKLFERTSQDFFEKKTPKRIGFAIKATQSCLHFIHILKFCAQTFNGVSHKDCKDYVTIRENFKQFNILVA